MHPKEQEIRGLASASPFAPFTLITSNGERYRVFTRDHIFFSPNTNERGDPLPDEDRAQDFIVSGSGSRYRILFFDSITSIDTGVASSDR
jgi:hypothetical protein